MDSLCKLLTDWRKDRSKHAEEELAYKCYSKKYADLSWIARSGAIDNNIIEVTGMPQTAKSFFIIHMIEYTKRNAIVIIDCKHKLSQFRERCAEKDIDLVKDESQGDLTEANRWVALSGYDKSIIYHYNSFEHKWDIYPDKTGSTVPFTDTMTITLSESPDHRSVSEHILLNTLAECDAIKYELNRISSNKTHEVILYCIDLTGANLKHKAYSLHRLYGCPVISHEDDNIFVYHKNQELKYSGYSISKALNFIEQCSHNGVIIVGNHLMTDGVTYTSKSSKIYGNGLVASVMFYKCENLSNVVGQISRITGESRYDITRRVVYCTQEVYDTYKHQLDLRLKGLRELGTVHKSTDKYSSSINTDDTVFVTDNKLKTY